MCICFYLNLKQCPSSEGHVQPITMGLITFQMHAILFMEPMRCNEKMLPFSKQIASYLQSRDGSVFNLK